MDKKLSVIFSIAILLSVTVIASVEFSQTADALKSKGTSNPKYGSATKSKVCGDRLCSEVSFEQKNNQDGETRGKGGEASHEDTDDMNHEKPNEKHKTASLADQHLKTFDELDFDVFTNQKWDRIHESHSQDIVVHWPDGRTTEGIEPHIEDLKAMFIWAPDTRIEQHPIKIASGQWTSVIGVIEGTFTQPMPLPDGTFIEPTGQSFKLTMNTVGYWEDGVMTEEYLFWDNLEFMKQIGLA